MFNKNKKSIMRIAVAFSILALMLISGILININRSDQSDEYESSTTETETIGAEEIISDDVDSSTAEGVKESAEVEESPESEKLMYKDDDLITRFLLKAQYLDYDAADAGSSSLLGNLTSGYSNFLIDWDIYPVDSEMQSLGGNYSTTDPRGMINGDDSNGGWWGATKTNADSVNWVAKNIFNATDEDIEEMLEGSKSDSTMGLYYQGGYYYQEEFPGGGPGKSVLDIISKKEEGQMQIIEYVGTGNGKKSRYALMAKKRIGGITYWTMYYNGDKLPEDASKYGRPSLRFQNGETYEVIVKEGVIVRSGPGKQYSQIYYDDLQDDEKKQASKDKMAAIKEGGKVVCQKMEGDWMRIGSGWICTYDNGEELVR